MDSTRVIENLNNNNSEMEDEFDSCTDDKVCIYETAITGEYIKQEPCDTKDEPGNIPNYLSIKDEIIQDPTIIVQEIGLTTNIKENYLACCDECGEEYDLYCLKCPMLMRIFNSNNQDLKDNKVMQTLPKNFVDLCETQSDVGIVALRVIPKGVVFGPFEELHSIKNDAVSKLISKNEKPICTNDPKCLNWMQHIRRVDQSSYPNLKPFQYENELYYRSDRHISVGEELLVCCDSDREEDGHLKQQICERLDDAYACILCCVGYKSICHLTAHNCRCPEKRKQNGFCKEIIQCDFCKIYINEKEYSDYHVDRCFERNTKTDAKHQEKKQSQRKGSDDHPAYYKDVKLFACIHCPYKTTMKQQLKEHIVIHNDDKLFGCSLCSYKSRSKANLKKHMASHNDDKPFKCTQCPHKAKTKSQMRRHIMVHDDDKPFACIQCPFKTKTKDQLQRHFGIHSDDKPFACSLCSYKTKTNLELKRHIATHDDKIVRCAHCPFKTKTNQHLKRHIGIHSDNKPFACSHCSFKTKTNLELKRHIIIHSDDKPFACTGCPYKTRRKQHLKEHIRLHNNDKPFGCTHCQYRTRTNWQLKEHIVIHNDDKPFACSQCPFNTKTHLRLKQHMISHNDDKPFACAHCPYKTKRKHQLKAHIAIHNDGKPFGCTQCPFETKTIAGLKSHIAIHSDDKRFACSLCSFKTKRNFELKRHIATHNKDDASHAL